MTTTATPTAVPACDLRAQYATLRDEIRAAIDEVLESQAFIMGPQVAALEKQVAAYCQCSQAVGCSSGSDALLLALMALEIGPGDEVITSPFTFFATVGAIVRLGAKPVFVDINPDDFNMNPAGLKAALTSRTKAIIPVHLFGQTADMAPINQFAAAHGLTVIEDAAQAIGAEYQGKRAGSMSRVGCLSFFPSKNLGAAGDGGMIVTSDEALAEKMRVLRTHGAKKKYFHTLVGGNFRLDTIHAAVLLVKLPYLDQWNDARRRAAGRYREMIQSSPIASKVALPAEKAGRRHIYNQFIIRTDRRDHLLEVFKSRKIGSAVYYPWPMHLQECFRNLGYKEGTCPKANTPLSGNVRGADVPELTAAQQEQVVAAATDGLAR